jgi:N-methylhydantoinase B
VPIQSDPAMSVTVSPLQRADDDFARAYHCDRFTASVLSTRLRYIAKHMSTDLLGTAFSVLLRDWYDFAATISGPAELDYCLPAQSESVTVFIGTMADAVRICAEEIGPDQLRPGDVFIANDPYRTGTHVNDTLFCRPVFHEGRIAAFASIQAHMFDMGGTVPGGFSTTKRNVYENGLVLGPLMLLRDDEPVRSTWSLLFDNARFGELMLPDIKTIVECLRLGERLILETIERYSLDAVHGAMRYACDAEAQIMASGIERVPDGDYRGEALIDADGVDDSEEYLVRALARVRGARLEVDFSGSSRQARGSINAGWLDTKSAVAVALKFLFARKSPLTSGAFRAVDIVLPEGTFFSAMPPDGAIFMYFNATSAAMEAILRALAPPLGKNAVSMDAGIAIHNAHGVHPDGTPWISAVQCGGEHGPWPASGDVDGDSYNSIYCGNGLEPATETIEAESPVVILAKEATTDTAGAGEFRGGAAIVKDTMWLSDAEHHINALHLKRRTSFGYGGGEDGVNGAIWLFEPEQSDEAILAQPGGSSRVVPVAGRLDDEGRPSPSGTYHYFGSPPGGVWHTAPGVVFRYLTNGAGGFGDPFSRDPDRVLRDVRNEYVSVEAAAAQYGVVVVGDVVEDPEGLLIDKEQTALLRAARTTTAERRTSGG